jgi:hypothetical protein
MSGRRNSSSPEATRGFRRGPALFPGIFRRGVVAGAVLVVATLFSATAASAYWPATGTGNTTAAVATLAPPTNVTVPAASNSNVSVAWTASTGTPAPTGYYVTRVTGASSMLACGSSPAALISGTACTDTSVPEGTHHYVVTAVYRSWTAVSAASGNVIVDNVNTVNYTVQPVASVTAGTALQSVTVELRTSFGIKLLVSGVPVTISIGNNPGGGTLSGTLTATTNIFGEATFAGLSINKAGTGYSLLASSPGYSGAVSTGFTVTAAVASKLAITNPASIAGTASASANIGPVTVERQDAYGNPVTTGSTTVTLASNSTGTKVFAATAGGASVTTVTIPAGSPSGSFFYGDQKAGSPNLTVTAAGLSADSKPATVSPAAASQLIFGQQPTSTTKGTTLTPAVTVLILDQFGNQTLSAASVSMAKTDHGNNMTGTLTKTAVNGVATFGDLAITGHGLGTTLTASSAGLPPVISNSFDIN